jgi:hypothetical protein
MMHLEASRTWNRTTDHLDVMEEESWSDTQSSRYGPPSRPSGHDNICPQGTKVMLFRKRLKVFVAQIGPLDRPKVENAVGLAQLVQNAFEIEFLTDRIDLPAEQYLLPNGGYDLDRAVGEIVLAKALPTPLILITSLPFGDREKATEPGCFYFSEEYQGSVSLISTYLWTLLQPDAGLQRYVLMMISAAVLSHFTELKCHDETAGCMFDFCADVRDVLRVFEGPGLCRTCEQSLMKQIRAGVADSFQNAAAMRIFDRAKGVRRCFLAMPFSSAFQRVHKTVARSVANAGWLIVRADEIARPRHLTDAIFQAIVTSDLVVADISGNNPNVFYELGFAHAVGCDIIMLFQKASAKRLPFDVAHERTLFYDTTEEGLRTLAEELEKLAKQA